MPASPGIAAHLILGARREPYLPAVLESIRDCAGHVVINDNSGCDPGPNDDVIAASGLAAAGRLTLVRTTFTGFADARNACIDATPAGARWALFVDADEVHGPELTRMAALLDGLPADVDAVDGYSRHFVGSFDWWRSVDRRLCFFRLRERRRWRGIVHEQLEPVGRRTALPAVWAHYGHVVTPRMEWEKSRLYSSLGQPGFSPTDADLERVDAAAAWGRMRGEVMRFHGDHPEAMAPVIERLRCDWAATFADVEALFANCTPLERLRRSLRRANFARVIALRGLASGARWNASA